MWILYFNETGCFLLILIPSRKLMKEGLTDSSWVLPQNVLFPISLKSWWIIICLDSVMLIKTNQRTQINIIKKLLDSFFFNPNQNHLWQKEPFIVLRKTGVVFMFDMVKKWVSGESRKNKFCNAMFELVECLSYSLQVVELIPVSSWHMSTCPQAKHLTLSCLRIYLSVNVCRFVSAIWWL